MRRLLSILLLVGLALAPAVQAIPAHALASGWTGQADESKIPACCRRGGKHHCMMGAAPSSGETTLSPTGCCPCVPHAVASVMTGSALLVNPELLPHEASSELVFSDQASRALSSVKQSQRPRGPPASLLL